MEATMLEEVHVSPVIDFQDESDSVETESQESSTDLLTKEDLDVWFSKTVLAFKSDRVLSKKELSEREFNFIKSNSVMSGVDVCYMLLAKYLDLNFESQLQCVLKVIRFLEQCRLPKDYMGGFMILIIKYHFLPV
jgi:putative transposon-encoded protein